jgi:hypothetical protein
MTIRTPPLFRTVRPVANHLENVMAKKSKRRIKRASWTKSNLAELRKYSKDKLSVAKISKLMKRTSGALRQKARVLGIRLGHRR